jgi:hypothetical protein
MVDESVNHSGECQVRQALKNWIARFLG